MGNLNKDSIQNTWNNQIWKDVRRAFLNDERHEACSVCWKKEDAGLLSARDDDGQFNKWKKLVDESGTAAQPQSLSIRLGNACNLKCIMCGPSNSTKWHEDFDLYEKHVGLLTDATRQNQVMEDDWLLESLGNCTSMAFLGGEPMIIKSHERVLKHFVESGRASEITLRYHSNATFLPDWCTDYWRHFKKIDFAASIDGVDDVYNYIRHPGNWKTVEQNLLKIDSLRLPNIDFGICYVFMNINAHNLEQLFKWRDSIDWKNTFPIIRPDYIEEPIFLQPHLLNTTDKKRVLSSLENILKNHVRHIHEEILVKDMARLTQQEDPQAASKLAHLKSYLEALDQRRQTHYSPVFELNSLPTTSPCYL